MLGKIVQSHEYYLLRVDKFDQIAETPLDEWISFLKTGDIPMTATAPGLSEARERLRIDSLDDAEKKRYYWMMENLRYQRSVIETGRLEGREEGREEGWEEGHAEGHAKGRAEGEAIGMQKGRVEGRKEGREEGRAEEKLFIAAKLKSLGLNTEQIAAATGLTKEEVDELQDTMG